MKNYKAEVAIIGGGIAGITAALELLNLGKKVIIEPPLAPSQDEGEGREEEAQGLEGIEQSGEIFTRLDGA